MGDIEILTEFCEAGVIVTVAEADSEGSTAVTVTVLPPVGTVGGAV
jgi:hypothetical protein